MSSILRGHTLMCLLKHQQFNTNKNKELNIDFGMHVIIEISILRLMTYPKLDIFSHMRHSSILHADCIVFMLYCIVLYVYIKAMFYMQKPIFRL